MQILKLDNIAVKMSLNFSTTIFFKLLIPIIYNYLPHSNQSSLFFTVSLPSSLYLYHTRTHTLSFPSSHSLSSILSFSFPSSPSPSSPLKVSEQLAAYQLSLRGKSKQLKAMASEVNMYQGTYVLNFSSCKFNFS